MSFREPDGAVMTANMKLLGWKRRIRASSLRGLQGRSVTGQNGQAAKGKKRMNVVRAGCRENTSGLRLRENYFSLDIPLYRTSGLPTIRPERSVPLRIFFFKQKTAY